MRQFMRDQPSASRSCRGVLANPKSYVVANRVRKRINTFGRGCRIGIGVNADI
jgi:hypothetical protein